MKRNLWLWVVIGATLLAAPSCEKGNLTAPADSVILVSAANSTLQLDPNSSQTEASTAITAQIYKENLAQEGVLVLFETNGGRLDSCVANDPADPSKGCTQQALRTDALGTVRDRLTVRIDQSDPDPIKVTAVSGAVSGNVEIRKVVGESNRPPVPAVVIAPRDQQAVNRPVVFDGSPTADPDDDTISCWRWTINSSNPDDDKPNPFVTQGSGINSFDTTFANVQDIAGSLQVTDNPEYLVVDPRTGQTPCDRGAPVIFEASAPFRYTIVRVLCTDNQAPVAGIVGSTDGKQASGAFNTLVSVLLNGTISSDPEQLPLDDYIWDCGNNFVAQEQPPNGSTAVCQYRVEGEAITYTATLVVKDRGTGEIDTQTGNYACQKTSAAATIKVKISPTIPPQ